MRDIKFRAYDNDGKEMLYNVQNTYDYSCTNDNKVMEDRFADLLNNQRYEVMQYTGLKDKNGVEIYEGDIYIQGDKNITYTVVWYDTGLVGKQNCSTSYAGLEYWKDRIEVIGNIYDNPELL